MKNKYFRIVLCIIIALSLYSCIYEEGDETAAQAFAMMTAQEKILYDAVEKQWNQKKLLPIRNAVRARKVKPLETEVPFKDLAPIIEKTNSVIMVMDSNWGEDTRAKKEKAKWNSIDPDWYRKILGYVGKTETAKKQNRVVRAIKSIESSTKPAPPKNPVATAIINVDDLIPLDEYEELRYMMRDCPEAKTLYDKIVGRAVPLTYNDRNKLYEKVLVCEAERVNNSLRGE